MAIKIALAGNPNCGKTTLFNALTGARQFVGNWPGVTVEKKEGYLKGTEDVVIQDLPGIYSLSPYTLEEVVSRTYLVHDKPDVILNIVDGTNIERNLYLTTQLIELGIPVVMAVNMMDLVEKSGDKIDLKKLASKIGCEAIEISALNGDNIKEAADLAVAAAREGRKVGAVSIFSDNIEKALGKIEGDLSGKVDKNLMRWYAIKVFERDQKVMESLSLPAETLKEIEGVVEDIETKADDDAESIITGERYEYISAVMQDTVVKAKRTGEMSISDRIDSIVTNRVLGLPIFVVIMFCIYAIAMGDWPVSIGTHATDFTNDVIFGEWVPDFLGGVLESAGIEEGSVLFGLIMDGIVAGVGAVLGFVPQMLVLFVLLAILEDVGYMSRIAFVMDRIFRQFGLSGKSFIPCLVATGCGVPGVMASRTIENDRDRRLTVMTTTFMPCSAKMPIIGLIAGAIFGGSPYVAASAYFIGIASIVLSGIILKKFKAFAGEPAPFVMELPSYHVPAWGNVARAAWERGFSFIKRAGTIILVSTIIIWFLSSFGYVNGEFGMTEELWEAQKIEDNESYIGALAAKRNVDPEDVNPMDDSLLASIGQTIAPVFQPLGFGNWKATVAAVQGLVAKEEVVATFGVLYNYDEDADGELGEEGEGIWARVADDYTPAAAMAFMMFNLLCAPCFAAIGAIRREMNNTRWTMIALAWMTVWAYAMSAVAYNLGGFIIGEVPFGAGTVFAIIVVAAVIYGLARKGYVPDEKIRPLTAVDAAAAE
ncbi:MAG: ferrous iron transport protein B [Selenomonadaceae bacterium]